MKEDIRQYIRRKLKQRDPAFRVLYKYQAFREYTCGSLKNNLIKYSTHAELNDAFDLASRFPSPFGPTCGQISALMEFVRPLEGTGFPLPKGSRAILEYVARRPKFKPLEALAIMAVQLPRLSLSTMLRSIRANDDWCGEVLFQAMCVTRHFVESAAIFCVSENPKSHLMWGYYGDGMRGLCVGYGCFVGHNPRIAHPVMYSHRLPVFDPVKNAIDFGTTSDNLLFSKPSAWRHETEWRLMNAGGRFDTGIFESPLPIVEAFVGYRMPKAQQRLVVEALAKHQVPVLEAHPYRERGLYRIALREPELRSSDS